MKLNENLKLFEKYSGRKLPLLFLEGEKLEGYDPTIWNITINSLYEFENIDPKRVKVYSRRGCSWCDRARAFFKKNNIEFTEHFIDESPKHKKEFVQLKGTGTPLILIGPNEIPGFNEKAIKLALKNADLM